jgi:hypothetical protein
MAHKNPLGKIKDVAATGLSTGIATGTHVAKAVTGTVAGTAAGAVHTAAGAVQALVGHKEDKADPSADGGAAEESPDITISPDEPVNVTEELGLDPAPVDKPKGPRKTESKPTTSIDAAADPSDVDVTPADVAQVVSKNAQDGDEDLDKPTE